MTRKPVAVGLDEVHVSPGHLMRRAQQIAVALFLDAMRDFDVTPVQFAALTAIKDNPGIDQRRLVDLIAIDRSTLGTLLRLLEAKKLIRRSTPDHNRRIKQLMLAPAGEKMLDAARAAHDASQKRILAPLNAHEKTEFMRLLGRLVEANNAVSRVPLKLVPKSRAD